MCVQLLLSWIPPSEVWGVSTLIKGWCSLLFFDPLKEPSFSCADREVFLDSGVVILSVHFNRAQLFGSFYHWFVWGKQSFSFTLLDKHQLSSPRAYLISYLKAVNYVGVGREFLARVVGIEAVGLDGPRKKWWSRWLGMEPR